MANKRTGQHYGCINKKLKTQTPVNRVSSYSPAEKPESWMSIWFSLDILIKYFTWQPSNGTGRSAAAAGLILLHSRKTALCCAGMSRSNTACHFKAPWTRLIPELHIVQSR